MCQVLGHIFGLGHQDEDFNNLPLSTCMDYTSDATGNTEPNQHDYDQLALIYEHAHGDDGGGGGGPPPGKGKPNGVGVDLTNWGRPVHADPNGRADIFERELPNGEKLVTHVTWAD